MPPPARPPAGNLLLRALPPEELDALRPALEARRVEKGEVVLPAGAPIEHAHFPEDGLASIVSDAEDGRRLEVGLFGREGMASVATLLGADTTPEETFAQVGGTWLRIGVDDLRGATARLPALRSLLLRYAYCHLQHVTSTALSNGAHTIEERLARWLLMSHDRLDGDDLSLTHGFLSLMLGVRRAGVTVAVHGLEGARLIRARRGVITVLDRAGLEAAAGDSYGRAEAEYERLIGPLSDKRRGRRERSGAAWNGGAPGA